MNFHYCALGCSSEAVSVHYKLLWINLLIYLASRRPLYVTVVYQGKYSHCMRIGVAVPLNSTVSRLREAVSRETKIPPDQVQFPQVFCTEPTCFFFCIDFKSWFKDLYCFPEYNVDSPLI